MNELQGTDLKTNVFSTKKLTDAQLQKFNIGIRVDSEDFIKISPNRISPIVLKKNLGNIVFTSKNAVESLLTNCSPAELQFDSIYCVGRKTKRLIQKKIGPVTHFENSATDLGNYLVEYMEGTQVTYFHGNLSLEDLPTILEENNITVTKVEAYRTKLSRKICA
ncbi:uroporphyrinogen-III synthase [Maribacter litopenaei]